MVDQAHCVEASTIEETTAHLEAWRQLSNHSLDDNIYTSPAYLIPALRHYGHRQPYKILFIYMNERRHSQRLIGVAAYSVLKPTLRIPCRVLSTYTTPLGFPSQPLVDPEYVDLAITALWDWIERPQQRWDLVLVNKVAKQSPTWMVTMTEIQRRDRSLLTTGEFQRPILERDGSYADYLQRLSSKRRKEYRRKWRRLNEAGTVETVLHTDLQQSPNLAQRFMKLEAKSWKGTSGTALNCHTEDSAFFEDVVHSIAEPSQLFFVELRLDGKAIAITSNFVAGSTLFAFKVAYDPQYAQFSPGLLNEFECMRLFYDSDDLQIGDSGSVQDSYLRHYWLGHMDMYSVYVTTPKLLSSVSMAYLQAGTSVRQSATALVSDFRRHFISACQSDIPTFDFPTRPD